LLLGAGEANGPPAAAKAKSRKQKTKTKRKARATLGHAPRRSDGERACASAYVEICAGGVELGRLECGEGFPEPLAMVDVSVAGDNATPGVEEFLYYLTDVQGSVGALTNAVGQVVERYFYTPYGQTQITADAAHGKPLRQPVRLHRPALRTPNRPLPLPGAGLLADAGTIFAGRHAGSCGRPFGNAFVAGESAVHQHAGACGGR